MKKSAEILGLPIISITEGRELGMSKTLLIDAQNGKVAAITIEDDDWYRGVKLIPYESVIAIGEDAVTITNSENILSLDEAGDYEDLLTENIRVIGTKAITKSGRIQGKVTEVIIGAGGKIEACEITASDGSINEVEADQISIFGKQVTVVDMDEEKKNSFVTEQPAFEPAFEPVKEEPQEVWTPPAEESTPETIYVPEENFETPPETQAALEEVMTPEPVEEINEEPFTPAIEEPPVVEEPVVEEPVVEESVVEEPVVEEPVVEEPVVEEPVVEEPVVEEPVVEEPVVEEPVVEEPVVEEPVVEEPVVEEPVVEEPVVEKPPVVEEKIAAMTRQAEDLKAALQKAKAQAPQPAKKAEKGVDERRRRVLLGKHATKTITAESGTLVVEAGAEVTEEVLQRARLSNKFIELSMNVQ